MIMSREIKIHIFIHDHVTWTFFNFIQNDILTLTLELYFDCYFFFIQNVNYIVYILFF